MHGSMIDDMRAKRLLVVVIIVISVFLHRVKNIPTGLLTEIPI
jgi:hypothetical protein